MPTIPDCFEAGLLDRLAMGYPARDVPWLAEEIAAAGSRIRNPSGALVGACKRADREDTHRLGTRPAAQARARQHGGFWANGDWNTDGSGLSALDAFVARLVRRRLESNDPPSAFALLIRQAEHEAYLPAFRARILDRWQDCDEPEDWPAMPTGSAVEEHLKRCGRALADHRWDPAAGIHWLPVPVR